MTPRTDLATIGRFFLRAAPRSLLLGIVLTAVTVATGIALLGVSGWFITATAIAGLSVASAIGFEVFMPSATIRLLALGRTVSRYAERVVTHDATLGVLAQLRERLFVGWAQPEAARELAARPSRWLFRLTADLDALESVYLRLAAPCAAAVGAAVLAGLLLAGLDAWLGVAAFVVLCAVGLGGSVVVMRRGWPHAVRRAKAVERVRSRTIDLVAGQTEWVMAGQLDAQTSRLRESDRQLARADLALNRLDVMAAWAQGVAGAIFVAAVLLAAAELAATGIATVPMVALAVLVAQSSIEPFSALRRGALEAGRTWLAARRIAPRLNAEGDCVRARPTPAKGVACRLVDASVRYSQEHAAALDGVTVSITAGERVSVIGPSGAGKSTLLSLLAGDVTPSQGDAAGLPTTWFTQRTELFQDTLRDNLRLADPTAEDTRLWNALNDAGLAHDIAECGQGLDTLLGEGGLGLSGGQSRRLALARLLLHDSPVWLLDEPTEALDASTARDVLDVLARRAGSRTVVIATHLRREAALADRLLMMRAGAVEHDVRRGTPEFDAALSALRPD
ncbi:ABC transporter permease [Pigmentiphaga litoralis]|uniref:amino acid ABC transporter ATP-binding/permease protein n=1 Tax=Pigmentiphaga litoralis TaxID=516702 RepID=UPI0016737A37|nr:ATP-binding cassette domain-containing protein [Pigmentiphaga litoralis]GGX18842.1 ABC transporter permease [Pigmentiphaga litoralis]